MQTEQGNKGIVFFITFIISAIAGLVVSILFAPHSGSLTRKRIKDLKDGMVNNTTEFYKEKKEQTIDMVDKSKDIIEGTKSAVSNVVTAGKDIIARR